MGALAIDLINLGLVQTGKVILKSCYLGGERETLDPDLLDMNRNPNTFSCSMALGKLSNVSVFHFPHL